MVTAVLLLLESVVPRIDHAPLDCFLHDRHPRVEAAIDPIDVVDRARVYFRGGEEEDYVFVHMALSRGRFGARLPRPRARSVTYFLEATTTDGIVRRTPEMVAEVVKKPEACGEGRLAPPATEGDVRVGATVTGQGKPRGFAGVSDVMPAPRPPAVAPAPEPAVPEPPAPVAPSPASPAPALPAAVPAPVPEYTIGPEDILRIVVYGHEDLSQTVVVQSDGSFVFPLVGRVQARDATTKDLERRMATALGQGFVRNPQVTVVVQEYRSRTVYVVGEVARPGPYPLGGSMSVVEVLAKAGPSAGAAAEVVIVRPAGSVPGPVLPDQAGGSAEVIRVNLRDIQMGHLDQNVFLRPNDTVFVAQAAKVYVTGEVRNPGAHVFTPGLTVRQAIGMAGGLSPDGSSSRLRVVRVLDGKAREVRIRLDDPLQAGDTIVVKAKLF
jgi:polysaccharide export outer membrane protein